MMKYRFLLDFSKTYYMDKYLIVHMEDAMRHCPDHSEEWTFIPSAAGTLPRESTQLSASFRETEGMHQLKRTASSKFKSRNQ